MSTSALQNGCPINTFEEWVDEQLAASTPAETEGAERGEALFLSKGCVACHTIRGNPVAAGKIGPDLTHFGSRSTLGAGMLTNTPQNLEQWLTDPDEIKPGNIMTRDAPVYNGDLEPLGFGRHSRAFGLSEELAMTYCRVYPSSTHRSYTPAWQQLVGLTRFRGAQWPQ